VGKTQFAINLALELVRRGHFAGLFSDSAAIAALDDILALPASALVPQRRAGDTVTSDAECRGYQGVDLLGCRIGLDDWPGCDRDRIDRCIHDLDTRDGYDDLMIDTSAMSAQAVLACCLAAHCVLVMVTPEAVSQAQAFALLRILKLNGFSGVLRLVVNRARYAMDGQDIQQSLGAQTRAHLDLDLPLLDTLIEDPHVERAQKYRQAFTTVFPDADASGCIVVLADQFEDIVLPAEALQLPLSGFWQTLRELLGREMLLPGMSHQAVTVASRAGGVNR